MLTDLGEAKALLEERGFKTYRLRYNPNLLPGMRWSCYILNVWAPVLGGKARDWGFTAKDAVLRALACNPVPEERK